MKGNCNLCDMVLVIHGNGLNNLKEKLSHYPDNPELSKGTEKVAILLQPYEGRCDYYFSANGSGFYYCTNGSAIDLRQYLQDISGRKEKTLDNITTQDIEDMKYLGLEIRYAIIPPFNGQFHYGWYCNKKITINKKQVSETSILITLAHELLHAYEDMFLKIAPSSDAEIEEKAKELVKNKEFREYLRNLK